MMRGYSCSRKAGGGDLKSYVSGFIKDFMF